MGQFLVLLLIVLGYFALLSFVIRRSDTRRSVSALAVILLLVYACAAAMAAAIGQYLGELGLLLYGGALVYCCLYWGWKLYRFIRTRPELQLGVVLSFAAYLLAVLYITTFMRDAGTNFKVQMEVLNWMKEPAQAGGGAPFQHVLLNVAMFMPVGILFPFLTYDGEKKLLPSVSFGLLFSVLIETGQLIFHYGACDIDDILANTLGAAIGALMAVIGQRLRKRPEKPRGKAPSGR